MGVLTANGPFSWCNLYKYVFNKSVNKVQQLVKNLLGISPDLNSIYSTRKIFSGTHT